MFCIAHFAICNLQACVLFEAISVAPSPRCPALCREGHALAQRGRRARAVGRLPAVDLVVRVPGPMRGAIAAARSVEILDNIEDAILLNSFLSKLSSTPTKFEGPILHFYLNLLWRARRARLSFVKKRGVGEDSVLLPSTEFVSIAMNHNLQE